MSLLCVVVLLSKSYNFPLFCLFFQKAATRLKQLEMENSSTCQANININMNNLVSATQGVFFVVVVVVVVFVTFLLLIKKIRKTKYNEIKSVKHMEWILCQKFTQKISAKNNLFVIHLSFCLILFFCFCFFFKKIFVVASVPVFCVWVLTHFSCEGETQKTNA